MAAPGGEEAAAAGGFAAWLAARLEALGLDRAVYGAYIQGLLREEESDEERLEALRGVLATSLVSDGTGREGGVPLTPEQGADSPRGVEGQPRPRRARGGLMRRTEGTRGHRPPEALGFLLSIYFPWSCKVSTVSLSQGVAYT